jgi:GNAT superfamily N-acetyltransferase
VPIELLTREHDHGQFKCTNPILTAYLKDRALKHLTQGFGRTFVFVEDGSKAILGYHTISAASASADMFPVSVPKLAIPVMLLGRLAVDENHQRQGIGKMLLADSLRRAVEFDREYGCFAVTLDAFDEEAKQYYLQFGFKELLDNPLHLFMTMKTVKKLGLLA